MLQNALVALLLGVPLAVLLIVPVAAVRYRRAGHLSGTDLAQLLAGCVYFCALWAYTLLPTPPSRELAACAPVQLELFAFVGDVIRAGLETPTTVVHNAALLQFVLNTALFAPLGLGVRLLLRRGVLTAALIGLSGSLIIEITQLTGIFGVYSCAYRLFDVDDLLANTIGAVLGSLVSAVVLGRTRSTEVLPLRIIPVSIGRRLLGLIADAVLIALVVILVAALETIGRGATDLAPRPDDVVDVVARWLVPAVFELVLVLRSGRTVGEWLVLIETVGRAGRWRQALLGATGYCLLGPLGLLQALFVVVTVVAILVTPDRRGLSRQISGTGLVARGKATSPVFSSTRDAA